MLIIELLFAPNIIDSPYAAASGAYITVSPVLPHESIVKLPYAVADTGVSVSTPEL